MLDWRLEAYKRWLTMDEPTWARVHYPKIDFQDMYFYSAPKKAERARRASPTSIRRCSRCTKSSACR